MRETNAALGSPTDVTSFGSQVVTVSCTLRPLDNVLCFTLGPQYLHHRIDADKLEYI